MQIKSLTAEQHQRWDQFVLGCRQATFFHRAGWQTVLEQGVGHRTHFLYAEQNGEIQAVLPLGEINSRLFGHALISTPFCVIGGVAGDNDQARSALIEAAVALAEQRRVDHLELRHRDRQCEHANWAVKDSLYVNFRKTIDPDPDVNLKAIPRKQRAMVRKGIAAGLQARTGTGERGLETFFSAYSESVRNLGTPVFSKRYFRSLIEVFNDDVELLIVEHDGALVAAVMSFYFRDEVLPYYGGGTSLARQYKGNDFMYWELMCRAAQRGVRLFDYGRSKIGTGSYSFKKNWGFEPEPLHYEYHLVKGAQVPDINPLNPKYRMFVSMWQRLPIPVSRLVGPYIARNLG